MNSEIWGMAASWARGFHLGGRVEGNTSAVLQRSILNFDQFRNRGASRSDRGRNRLHYLRTHFGTHLAFLAVRSLLQNFSFDTLAFQRYRRRTNSEYALCLPCPYFRKSVPPRSSLALREWLPRASRCVRATMLNTLPWGRGPCSAG